ncbi:hypothetical protein BD311DRAFT_703965 [Dichomitus squalens]|uniref:AB hydrolase-1 domain-containing protein n=1 Tax=Dichomitus squalens TaxID=114155 RepID=A0A4Q9MCF5_9APHY|nr:hypothetical protein BD311DRAFT_703965 [Dichomitus squalens]
MDTPPDVSTTPTPDSPSTDTSGSSQQKKRRQVAFYPNMNSMNKPQKPFSRSAAKRESVMALGSIEYLQHYFTKTGIAAESDPLKKPKSGLVPAIGGLATLEKRPNNGGPTFVLPPSPAIPQAVHPTFPPYVKTLETDPDNLRPAVIEDLISVAAGWVLNPNSQQQPKEQEQGEQDPNLLGVGGGKHNRPSSNVDVLDLLKNTTRAVRSVRNYLVSLPDDQSVPQNRPHFRPNTLSSSPLPKRQVSQPNSPHDPLTRIRGRALEVLAVLRELEERARLPLDHDAYDAQSDHGSSSNDTNVGPASRGTSPSSHLEDGEFADGDTSVSVSFIDVGGRKRQVPVWDDESDDFNHLSEEDREKRERWDERLVLGGGWLYRQDLRMEDLEKEREVVSKYLDAVDEVLFGGPKDGQRGWEREKERVERKERMEREARAKGRRVSAGDAMSSGESSGRAKRRVVSTGMLDAMRNMVVTEEPEEMESIEEEEAIDDDELPLWAKRSTFPDDDYGRLHALLVALLPATLLRLLPMSSSEHADILRALSSGQLLCNAYNTAVRRSRKPWGYVSKDAIHDIAALEEAQGGDGCEAGKRGWTFRRTDNLRLWAAALKLRYSLPIAMPGGKRRDANTRPGTPGGGTPVVSPIASTITFPAGFASDDAIIFDAPLVARMEEGWELMLERVVFKWMEAVPTLIFLTAPTLLSFARRSLVAVVSKFGFLKHWQKRHPLIERGLDDQRYRVAPRGKRVLVSALLEVLRPVPADTPISVVEEFVVGQTQSPTCACEKPITYSTNRYETLDRLAATRFHVFCDSGAPPESTDYTTIVLLHGLGWHSGVFGKLIPLAHKYNVRLVLVNRRDYPGAVPYTAEERAHLLTISIESQADPAAAQPKMVAFMKNGGHDLHDLLVSFVATNNIPLSRSENSTGGIVLAGWSLGTCWMTAFLASTESFRRDNVDLSKYVRRVVFYDPPSLALGYALIEDGYTPFADPSILAEDFVDEFNLWVSGFYQHGDTKDTLTFRDALASPPPTLTTLSTEERGAAAHSVPADPRGGSDLTIMVTGMVSGAFATLHEEALILSPAKAEQSPWNAVEVRHVCCGSSSWVMPWAMMSFQEELREKKNAGQKLRNVTFVRLRGANHFVHWEEPDRALQAFLDRAPI